MTLRLRFPELLEERGLTAYGLAKMSKGRIKRSTAYRLCALEGRLESFNAEMLEALADTLQVEVPDLFERSGRRRRSKT